MSKTTVVYPIVACLDEACNFLKTKEAWRAVNEKQTVLLERHYTKDVTDLEKIQDILDTMSSTDNKEIMKFLEDRGFKFDIDPFGEGEFGVASVLNVLVEWLSKHEEYPITVGDKGNVKKYPGVFVEENYEVFESNKHEHPIVMLKTKSDETVYLTVADKEYEDLELAARIKDISANLEQDWNYKNVIFPMVELEQDVDISWIVKINVNDSSGLNWYVSEAQQKTRFKMNHIGAKAESAVTMTLRCCSAMVDTKPPVVIDKPFFVWMTRPGLNDPLFMGYINEEDWKDPGDFHSDNNE